MDVDAYCIACAYEIAPRARMNIDRGHSRRALSRRGAEGVQLANIGQGPQLVKPRVLSPSDTGVGGSDSILDKRIRIPSRGILDKRIHIPV